MTRAGTCIFVCGIAAFLTAAMAQELPVGTQLPNGGGVITGYGVGPKGNPTYITTKGPLQQSTVNTAAAAAKVTTSSGSQHGTWNVVKNPPAAPAVPAPAPVKSH